MIYIGYKHDINHIFVIKVYVAFVLPFLYKTNSLVILIKYDSWYYEI